MAAIVERDGAWLVVEESIAGRAVFNQPAGHLEDDESLVDAVVREVREETGWRFTPSHVVGIYLWRSPEGATSLRVAFGGEVDDHDPSRALDHGILRWTWIGRAALAGSGRLRSPLVLRCIDDARAGARHPLALLAHVPTDG